MEIIGNQRTANESNDQAKKRLPWDSVIGLAVMALEQLEHDPVLPSVYLFPVPVRDVGYEESRAHFFWTADLTLHSRATRRADML